MLVKRHVPFLTFGRLLTPHRADAPPAVFQKITGAAAGPCASGAPMTQEGRKGKLAMQFGGRGKGQIRFSNGSHRAPSVVFDSKGMIVMTALTRIAAALLAATAIAG